MKILKNKRTGKGSREEILCSEAGCVKREVRKRCKIEAAKRVPIQRKRKKGK